MLCVFVWVCHKYVYFVGVTNILWHVGKVCHKYDCDILTYLHRMDVSTEYFVCVFVHLSVLWHPHICDKMYVTIPIPPTPRIFESSGRFWIHTASLCSVGCAWHVWGRRGSRCCSARGERWTRWCQWRHGWSRHARGHLPKLLDCREKLRGWRRVPPCCVAHTHGEDVLCETCRVVVSAVSSRTNSGGSYHGPRSIVGRRCTPGTFVSVQMRLNFLRVTCLKMHRTKDTIQIGVFT